MTAMGGNLGMDVDLRLVPVENASGVRKCNFRYRNDTLLFSESAGRFIVTLDPTNQEKFEVMLDGCAFACIGKVTEQPDLKIVGLAGETIADVPVKSLKAAWKKTFGSQG